MTHRLTQYYSSNRYRFGALVPVAKPITNVTHWLDADRPGLPVRLEHVIRFRIKSTQPQSPGTIDVYKIDCRFYLCALRRQLSRQVKDFLSNWAGCSSPVALLPYGGVDPESLERSGTRLMCVYNERRISNVAVVISRPEHIPLRCEAWWYVCDQHTKHISFHERDLSSDAIMISLLRNNAPAEIVRDRLIDLDVAFNMGDDLL